MLKLYDLTTEYKREPPGLDEAQPRFGWTNYRKRLQYQTCAVTLHSGKNRMALTLANGWYKGKLGFMPQPDHYGDTTAAPQPARLFDYGFDTLIFQLPGRFLVDNFCRADGGRTQVRAQCINGPRGCLPAARPRRQRHCRRAAGSGTGPS